MLKAEKETVNKDIINRLDTIALHFEYRDSFGSQLEQFTGSDTFPKSPKYKDIRRLVKRIEDEEIQMIYELVHLMDNAEGYFKIYKLNLIELNVVNQFKPYKVAANFVNVHKHGTRGRNRPSAKIDYQGLIFKRENSKPSTKDVIIGVRSIINYDGALLATTDLIDNLIQIWRLFLECHTEVDIKPFNSRINTTFVSWQGQSIYSLKIPEGLLVNAKKLSEERKHLNLRGAK